jgi:acyl-coenzyme A thioesterase PaaI-like protein
MSTQDPQPPALTAEEVSRLIDDIFPEIHAAGRRMCIVSVGPHTARVRLGFDAAGLRPGGTVSGPVLFTLADFSIYVCLLATLGCTAIQAVTSNLNITFLKRPEPVDVLADVRLIRLGRRLAYADVALSSVGREGPVAHATGTYALPRSSR